MGQNDKAARRQKIKLRSKTRGQGTAASPRLCVFRSVSQIYAQLVDDVNGATLLAVSSMAKENKELKGTKTEVSHTIGKQIGEKALAQGITKVIFDRNGFRYHGRVKALAEGAREAGLVF
ncbi:MAG: 50S ribosomal protein L18 [Prosthecochloris sp.]|uniref:Large ribosomal subunit protein uL18 n=1 Tax=Prosthecochloris aestuarii (strain DSM 271 / SK 413) TaxID=290512 RepID=RL18_PROA2|nr:MULTISPECIES: 50S ribosomal protein L18 [Prosthecochloris]B4S5B2.1 RecName: Full=Large ribosomal subunit protein uL18; AltName: Full=50S ribosomal protein L18 [Prosthecochloris aestuarii DSM 271]ACF47058.1 ribosomal protein L18 [Prosthecochloris aestuarii DSM 271]MCW8797432.1 50S ribosomal protein L18 [Prosthecochloris sp.]NEX11154.1 50S ribosomal protein L18 [Prosthecochloris sp.]